MAASDDSDSAPCTLDEQAAGPELAAGKRRIISRRSVLVAGVATATVGVVAAAGFASYRFQARYGRDAGVSVRDHRVALPADRPKLVIAKGTDPARNVERVLREFGGMETFVKKGDVVLIKPNIAWERSAAYAANTDPRVVAAIVRACKAAGADEVLVTDCPCHESKRTFRLSGIQKAAEAAGARVVLPEQLKHLPVAISKRLGTWDVLEAFIGVDKIINAPVAKHHGSARVTAGMKNWIGITLRSRSEFHSSLDETIAELAALMKPTLTIVDATRILLRNGPKGGNLADVREAGALAASVDPVAIDAWATELLGAKQSEVEYLALAAAKGLGTTDYRSLHPRMLKVG